LFKIILWEEKRSKIDHVLLKMGEVFVEHGYEATSLNDLEMGLDF